MAYCTPLDPSETTVTVFSVTGLLWFQEYEDGFRASNVGQFANRELQPTRTGMSWFSTWACSPCLLMIIQRQEREHIDAETSNKGPGCWIRRVEIAPHTDGTEE